MNNNGSPLEKLQIYIRNSRVTKKYPEQPHMRNAVVKTDYFKSDKQNVF